MSVGVGELEERGGGGLREGGGAYTSGSRREVEKIQNWGGGGVGEGVEGLEAGECGGAVAGGERGWTKAGGSGGGGGGGVWAGGSVCASKKS
jgi:hypothetical protein